MKRSSLPAILLVIAALALWGYDQLSHFTREEGERTTESPSAPTGNAATFTGRHETYRNCRLIDARNNDGDSFMVALPGGRGAEFRLYFVDAPESAFKSYRGGDTNHARIRHQAADLGGITPEQAVGIGRRAKDFTLKKLAARPFTLHTTWDSPFKDGRYHAFIEIETPEGTRWLHELLVENGLARIHTKPAGLPDGTPASVQRRNLRQLEREAQRRKHGAWGL